MTKIGLTTFASCTLAKMQLQIGYHQGMDPQDHRRFDLFLRSLASVCITEGNV